MRDLRGLPRSGCRADRRACAHPDRMRWPIAAATTLTAGPAIRRHDDSQDTLGFRKERRDKTRRDMTIGPVQMIVLGFPHPDFHGAIIAELERLRASDTVKVIDALAVHKDDAGEIEVAHLSNLTDEEAVEFGTVVGALIGLGIEGEEGLERGRRGRR